MPRKRQGHLDFNILDEVFTRANKARLNHTSVIPFVIHSISLKTGKKEKRSRGKKQLDSHPLGGKKQQRTKKNNQLFKRVFEIKQNKNL